LLLALASQSSWSAERASAPTPAERGYKLLVEKAYLPPDFDQQTFDAAWKFWPEPLRSQAEKLSLEERQRMAFVRYGLTPRPDDPKKPLQYVVDERGNWTMNCFACHGGFVPSAEGPVVFPGAPNSRLALQTLTEETREAKLELHKPLARMDLGSAVIPLGSTNGTTNAVMFGVVLLAMRDADLNLLNVKTPPKMTHHDMDAPPWWHFQRKKMMYIDGFAEKGHRALMQFQLVPSNGPEKFRQWEEEFRDIYAYLSSLEAPKYPFAIDAPLAERGRVAYRRICADCHGTYGPGGKYPERRIPIEELGTDPVRLRGLTPTHREVYGRSWFADYGAKTNVPDPGGYVAPPLDGIWATAPYFHNGSVPTLWHVLHPDQRPVVWIRALDGFDTKRVGPAIAEHAELPAHVQAGWQRREFFDTRRFGKSAAGHRFPDDLSEDEKIAVLEYLKTL
jgi:mono/diheme cytochrome c family protein